MRRPARKPPAATAPDLLAAVGRRLRRAREARGDSRAQLARRARISERYLAALEAGEGNISLLRLAAVLGALGLDWADVLGGAEGPGASPIRAGRDASHPARAGVRRRIEDRLATRSLAELREVETWLGRRFPDHRPLVALIGLRGAGKSTVGRALARHLGVGFFELDDLVEAEAGLPREQIFELQGPARYRDLEHQALLRFLHRQPAAVLATGGGLVTAPETYARLRAGCLTIWLRARPEEHWERVVRQGDQRPMQGKPAAMQELRSLLAAREPLYALAQITCDTSGRSAASVSRHLATILDRGKRWDGSRSHTAGK